MAAKKPRSKPAEKTGKTRSHAGGPTEKAKAQKAERVDEIVDMMTELRWQRGKTARDLAAKWGVARATVETYAAEASRRVKGSFGDADREAIRASIAARLDYIATAAMAAQRPARDGESFTMVPAPDYKAAITALTSFAAVLGLQQREAVADDGPTIDETDELLRRLDGVAPRSAPEDGTAAGPEKPDGA